MKIIYFYGINKYLVIKIIINSKTVVLTVFLNILHNK